MIGKARDRCLRFFRRCLIFKERIKNEAENKVIFPKNYSFHPIKSDR